ncbi:uncharacterized protein C8Q71DRAFT_856034 [Rhodofomes roseus]|uniref:Uncharacterized protein n=1 Tax=Rhodofomes roseus TaxID=34475 RepID=A0ABQ8KNM8_9APHY|nr:uncharacterized protein C8Q71DRAFT_856034 [Rhodofomes roseus]KAH9839421.1 hypothetical protein C8Q71DRAFT_856034 [Rhodofomes roseus]
MARSHSTKSKQKPSSSASPNSNIACHFEAISLSKDLRHDERSPTGSTPSVESGGPDRATPSLGTASGTASSSSSALYPLDLNVPPLDFQLPPAPPSVQSMMASRARIPVSTTGPSRNPLAGCRNLVPSNASTQPTVSLVINRSHVVYHPPTYPDATPLGSHNRDPTKPDANLFDDIVTMLSPLGAFHAPTLGFHRLARRTPRRPLILVGNGDPFDNPNGQGDFLTEMLLMSQRGD